MSSETRAASGSTRAGSWFGVEQLTLFVIIWKWLFIDAPMELVYIYIHITI